MNDLDLNKKAETRDGRAVEIKFTNGRGEYPIGGYVGNQFCLWAEDGKLIRLTPDSPLDLVNVAELRRVPLEFCDIPPASVFRKEDEVHWWIALECSDFGVKLGGERLAFTWLMRHNWQIKRPTDTDWQPCWKEVEV